MGADRSLGIRCDSRLVKDHAGSGDPAVMLQEPAEAIPALDLPGSERDDVRSLAAGHGGRDDRARKVGTRRFGPGREGFGCPRRGPREVSDGGLWGSLAVQKVARPVNSACS